MESAEFTTEYISELLLEITTFNYKEERLSKIKGRRCSECHSPMKRRPNQFREGTFWWGCTSYPACTYKEKD